MERLAAVVLAVALAVFALPIPLVHGPHATVAPEVPASAPVPNAQPEQVNVYLAHSSLPAPIGIADYGIMNSSGSIIPYIVRYREVTGQAEIYEIKAYNPSPPQGISPYGASLQLNVVLQVIASGRTYDYWLQDVPVFLTNESVLFMNDNIWNMTASPSELSNATVTGNGAVYSYSNEYYYAYSTSSQRYSLPLGLRLVIAITYSGSGVNVGFGYSADGSPLTWYDNATVHQPGTTSAFMLVDGYEYNPIGTYYDAELVFGGEGNAESTNFTQMNATLSLSYTLLNGTAAHPPEMYGFGSDTAEAADDLSSYLVDGQVTVTVGQGNFEPLVPLYTVTFYETGLPAGTAWSVTFDGVTKTSTGSSVTFTNVPAGTYSYSASYVQVSPDTRYAAGSGTVQVSGNTAVSLSYSVQYYVSVSAYPQGAGLVQGSGWYTAGSSALISAEASRGWRFEGWNGSGPGSYSGNSNPASITVNGPLNETALFYAGITFGASGLSPQAQGVVVTVNGVSYSFSQLPATVYAAPGTRISYSFSQYVSGGPGVRFAWENATGLSANESGTLEVVSPGNVTAGYAVQYYVSLQASPPAGGSVSPQSGWQSPGSLITVGAAPAPGYAFINWTGSGPGSYSGTSESFTLRVEGPVNETAYFALPRVTFEAAGLEPSGSTALYVRIGNASYAISAGKLPFTVSVPAGSELSYSWAPAVQSSSWERQVWQSANDSLGTYLAENGSIVIPSLASLVIAADYRTQYYVLVSAYPQGAGLVQGSGWYYYGSSASISAGAAEGYVFELWRGSGPGSYSGPAQSFEINVSGPVNETAVFYVGVTVITRGSGHVYNATSGSVISSTVYLPFGSQVALRASPSSALYAFYGWSGNFSGSSPALSFTVSRPAVVVASFGINWPPVLGILAALAVAVAIAARLRRRRA